MAFKITWRMTDEEFEFLEELRRDIERLAPKRLPRALTRQAILSEMLHFFRERIPCGAVDLADITPIWALPVPDQDED